MMFRKRKSQKIMATVIVVFLVFAMLASIVVAAL